MAEVCQVHEMTLKNFQQFQENQKEIVNAMANMRERIVQTEQSAKSAHHRLDRQEEQTQAIVKMSNSVEYMARQVEETIGILKEHDGRLDKLEKAPGDAMVAYWKLFIGALVTGFTGIVVGAIGVTLMKG